MKIELLIACLFLSLKMVHSGSTCPEKCTCEESKAGCMGKDLDDIPGGFPLNTESIDLSRNRISSLKENILSTSFVVDLKRIDLSHNEIYMMNRMAFYYEKRLSEIDLSFNRITRINSRTFRYNQALTKLSLRGNNGLHLTKSGHFIYSDTLTQLDMSQCGLQVIPNNTFERLPNMEHLNLSHNQIKTLEPQAFAGMDQLKNLDLSNNQLSTLVLEVLRSVLHLDTLVFSGSRRMKRASVAVELMLQNNPWDCDCQMKEVFMWCMSVNYDPGLICQKPDSLAHKSWEELADDTPCIDRSDNQLQEMKNDVEIFNTSSHRTENYEGQSDEDGAISPAVVPGSILIVLLIVLAGLILNFMRMMNSILERRGMPMSYAEQTADPENAESYIELRDRSSSGSSG